MTAPTKISEIQMYAARCTIQSDNFGTFTQDHAMTARDCLEAPMKNARLIAKALAKCAMGKVVSVELIEVENNARV